MKITALIMAGGRGERLKTCEEKPLLKLCGKPIIQYVIEALRNVENIDRIIIATTKYTQKTARKMKMFSVEVVETPGEGYITDVRYVIKKLKLRGPVIVVSADLPLINSGIINKVIERFKHGGKPALSVMVPYKLCKEMEVSSDIILNVNGNFLVPVGINILKCEMIDRNEIPEEKMVLNEKKAAINVNTMNDLRRAEKILSLERKQVLR